jgi:hypothetical protein
MTDAQFNKLLIAMNAQTVVLHGMLRVLTAYTMKQGVQATGVHYKEAQVLIDQTAQGITIPG